MLEATLINKNVHYTIEAMFRPFVFNKANITTLLVCLKIKKLFQERFFFLMVLTIISNISLCQNLKNTPSGKSDGINITTVQNLQFGYFTQGASGGSISISADGSRSATGSVVPLNFGFSYSQAIFEIEAPVGSVISMLDGQSAILNGSNGGNISLQIDRSIPATPFYTTIAPPGKTQINVGGTLAIGNTSLSPPGNYTGNFIILFLVE